MVGLQTLDLAIGVRVPASQPIFDNSAKLEATLSQAQRFVNAEESAQRELTRTEKNS